MTPNSTYIDWLDREISEVLVYANDPSSSTRSKDSYGLVLAYLKECHEKFLSLYPSQTIDSQEVNTKINDKEE